MTYIIHSFPVHKRILPLFSSNRLHLDGILYSYLDRDHQTLQDLYHLKRKFGTIIMLDSGAYSIMAATVGGSATGVVRTSDPYLNYFIKSGDWDRYVQDYIAYIRRHRHILDLYVELDLQLVVGEDKVWDWRAEFKAEGLKPIIVWHGEDEDTTKELVRLTGYFGIPHFDPDPNKRGETQYLTPDQIQAVIDIAKSANWIHGFGYGIINDRATYNQVQRMSSIDATSAVMLAAYGKICIAESDRLKIYRVRDLPDFSIIRNADPELYDILNLEQELRIAKLGKTMNKLLPVWNAMQIQKYYNRPYLLP